MTRLNYVNLAALSLWPNAFGLAMALGFVGLPKGGQVMIQSFNGILQRISSRQFNSISYAMVSLGHSAFGRQQMQLHLAYLFINVGKTICYANVLAVKQEAPAIVNQIHSSERWICINCRTFPVARVQKVLSIGRRMPVDKIPLNGIQIEAFLTQKFAKNAGFYQGREKYFSNGFRRYLICIY